MSNKQADLDKLFNFTEEHAADQTRESEIEFLGELTEFHQWAESGFNTYLQEMRGRVSRPDFVMFLIDHFLTDAEAEQLWKRLMPDTK